MMISSGQLRFIASLTRRVPIRGTARILRRIHTPSSREAAVDAVISIEDGLSLHASTRSDIEWLLFFYGTARFEPGIRKALRAHVEAGAFVIDVGANVGVHALAMAKYAFPGRVAAFEPSPEVRRRLEANIELNALTNIDVHPIALGDREGTADLRVPANDPDMSPYASLRPNSRYLAGSTSVDVTLMRLDTFVSLNALPKVSLIKIDVEGLEPEVLVGATETLARDKPILLLEYDEEWWREAGHSFAEVISMLSGLGYNSYSEITNRGTRRIGAAVPKSMNVLAVCEQAG